MPTPARHHQRPRRAAAPKPARAGPLVAAARADRRPRPARPRLALDRPGNSLRLADPAPRRPPAEAAQISFVAALAVAATRPTAVRPPRSPAEVAQRRAGARRQGRRHPGRIRRADPTVVGLAGGRHRRQPGDAPGERPTTPPPRCASRASRLRRSLARQLRAPARAIWLPTGRRWLRASPRGLAGHAAGLGEPVQLRGSATSRAGASPRPGARRLDLLETRWLPDASRPASCLRTARMPYGAATSAGSR